MIGKQLAGQRWLLGRAGVGFTIDRSKVVICKTYGLNF